MAAGVLASLVAAGSAVGLTPDAMGLSTDPARACPARIPLLEPGGAPHIGTWSRYAEVGVEIVGGGSGLVTTITLEDAPADWGGGGAVIDTDAAAFIGCILEFEIRMRPGTVSGTAFDVDSVDGGRRGGSHMREILEATRVKLEPFPGEEAPEVAIRCWATGGSDWWTVRVPMDAFRVPLDRIAQIVFVTVSDDRGRGRSGTIEIRNLGTSDAGPSPPRSDCDEPRIGGFGEVWSQLASYRSSNFAERAPLGEEDFPLHVTSARLGAYAELARSEGSRTWLGGYGLFELVHDFDWRGRSRVNVTDVRYQLGGGIRLRFEHLAVGARQQPKWLEYWSLDGYVEYRRQGSFVGAADSLIATRLESDDAQGGVRLWTSARHLETYAVVRYSTNALANRTEGPFLLATVSPRALLPLIGRFSLYANPELVFDVLGAPENANPYGRNVKLFVGGRLIAPLESLGLRGSGLLLWAEYGWTHFLERPQVFFRNDQLELHTVDFRAGVQLWLPIGGVWRPLGQVFGG